MDKVRHVQFFSQVPQKPKGFLWSRTSNFFLLSGGYSRSLCEAAEVKMEARSEILIKFHVEYSFAPSRRDCVRYPSVPIILHFMDFAKVPYL